MLRLPQGIALNGKTLTNLGSIALPPVLGRICGGFTIGCQDSQRSRDEIEIRLWMVVARGCGKTNQANAARAGRHGYRTLPGASSGLLCIYAIDENGKKSKTFKPGSSMGCSSYWRNQRKSSTG